MTDYSLLMKIAEQGLRTRVMVLEDAIRQYLRGFDDRDDLVRALGDVNVDPWMKGTNVSDEFERMRRLSQARRNAEQAWEQEVRELRSAGFSLRAIAPVAGVSHDTIWKWR